MNVLVTGGAGYIGSHTSKVLRESGYTPIVFDDLSTGNRWSVKWGPLVVGNLSQTESLEEVLRQYNVDAVIHFAASAYVGESMKNPEKYFFNNISNTLSLLSAMMSRGLTKFVYSSSCAVYGLPQFLPINEMHPKRPISPYGESKLIVERILQWYGELRGLSWASLRYFNAAGADPEGDIGEYHVPETHLIPLAIETALEKRACLEVYGIDYDTPDGTAVRDYVHVSDLAKAHILSLEHLLDGGNNISLNLGTGNGLSVGQILSVVERVSGRKIRVKNVERRIGDPPILIADANGAQEVLGWKPAFVTPDKLIETAWRWHSSLRS